MNIHKYDVYMFTAVVMMIGHSESGDTAKGMYHCSKLRSNNPNVSNINVIPNPIVTLQYIMKYALPLIMNNQTFNLGTVYT